MLSNPFFADFARDLTIGLESIPLSTAILRLLAAAALGSLIGWEREVNDRPAGLRTHMLIALASALFALLAMELTFLGDETGVRLTADPLRMIEAVTSGVAFLAAGSIITSGGKVTGLTTGASMWMAGAVGLACGIGKLQLAGLATVFALTVLWLVRRLMTPVGRPPED